MFERLFPEVPEDLAALGDEELSNLLSDFRDVSARLRANEIDLTEAFGEDVSRQDASDEAMRQWQEAAETVREIRALQAARQEATERFQAEADQLDAVFAEGEPEPEAAEEEPAEPVEPAAELAAEAAEPTEDDEGGEGDEEPAAEPAEPVIAAAEPATEPERQPVLYPAFGGRHSVPATPADSGDRSISLVAAGGLRTAKVIEGEPLDRDSYADRVLRVIKSLGPVQKMKGGTREFVTIAKARHEFASEMTLDPRDPIGNSEKIAMATLNPLMGKFYRAAVVATGGICAPPTPLYTLPQLGVRARPVRDFLPSFMADRGGISIPGVTTIADVVGTDAITVIEAADDAEGGTFATKTCLDQTCAEWTDVQVGAIVHCRTFGNFNARTWPEGVAHENENTMIGHARTAEGRLLDQMDALSLDLTGVATYGASSSLAYALMLSRVGMISRLRLDPDQRVQALLPFWAADMFAADLLNGATGGVEGRFLARTAVSGLLARYGIDVGWHLDEGLDAGADTEVFPAEVDGGTQDDWPGSTVVARVFLPGTFLHLDGGELELGIVRDSTLNETNDYETFGETFEAVGRIGPAQAAHRLTITVCPTGQLATPASAFSCNAS